MKIFVLNRGSSTIKCYLYELKEVPKEPIPPLWQEEIEWKNDEGKKAKAALQALLKKRDLAEVSAIGHRIVHGGHYFSESVRITREVKERIRELSELAPLHNLPELEAIEILEGLFPDKPQIAVFDTAFHHTLPQAAQIYPGPYRWYEEGIRRYGFHGISYQYCTRRARDLIGSVSKMIICHLGSGASLCAVKEGKSIDTTMGFTPLEGLMMDTRSGTIDPGIILHLLKKKKAEEISKELYDQSGLLGLSGLSSDMRDILNAQSNPQAKLALDVYLHRLSSCIGSMIATLQGLDLLVFTAGIGENAALVRKRICDRFSFLGIKLSENHPKEDGLLSTSDSKVKVLLIHTQEAFEIAAECRRMV
jgi:acetate kinase